MGHEMSWYDLSNKTFSAERLCSNIYFQYFSSLFLSKKRKWARGRKKKPGIGYKRRFALFQWCRQNSSFILGLAMFVASKYAKTRYCYKITPSYLLLVSTRERFLYKRNLEINRRLQTNPALFQYLFKLTQHMFITKYWIGNLQIKNLKNLSMAQQQINKYESILITIWFH